MFSLSFSCAISNQFDSFVVDWHSFHAHCFIRCRTRRTYSLIVESKKKSISSTSNMPFSTWRRTFCRSTKGSLHRKQKSESRLAFDSFDFICLLEILRRFSIQSPLLNIKSELNLFANRFRFVSFECFCNRIAWKIYVPLIGRSLDRNVKLKTTWKTNRIICSYFCSLFVCRFAATRAPRRHIAIVSVRV